MARERPLRTAALETFPGRAARPVAAQRRVVARRRARGRDPLGAAGEALRAVEIRDRYLGEPLPKGQVSLTVGLRFQESARTLTGEEVQAAVDQVALALRKAGVDIRGEAGG